MLQNGPLPRMFGESVIDSLFSGDTKCEKCVAELKSGFEKLGFISVFNEFPIMRHLFQTTALKLTPQYIIKLFSPVYSEGSSAYTRGEQVHSLFVKYLREVGSGNRCDISLNHILSFVTSCTEEPAFGFSIKPSLTFVASTESDGCVNSHHHHGHAQLP